jgi:hypothetical protein
MLTQEICQNNVKIKQNKASTNEEFISEAH